MSLSDILNIAIGSLGFFCVYILNDLTKSVRDATKEISELNIKIGTIIARHESQEKEIDDMKESIVVVRDRIHTINNHLAKILAREELKHK